MHVALTARSLLSASLGAWLGVVMMSAAAAGVIFPTIKRLKPALPDYAAYTGEHYLIAAGRPANHMFLAASIGEVVFWATAAACCWVARHALRRGAATLVLGLGLLLGARLVDIAIFRADLTRHWDAARAGQNAEALDAKARLDARHGRMTAMMAGQAALLAVGVVWVSLPRRGEGAA